MTAPYARGSREWLVLCSDSATWQLANDRALQREVLAVYAAECGRRFMFHGVAHAEAA